MATIDKRNDLSSVNVSAWSNRSGATIDRAAAKLRDDSALLGATERRIQKCGVHTELAQRADLVLHERDQRRDHDPDAIANERRDLIANGFPAARRHENRNSA